MSHKVSVIIPNYNHARFLKERIDSILNQTFQDFELIILDDASTDNSQEIIENYRSQSKVKQIIYNTQNSGSPFLQWVKGVELAKGELIWIAESDDVAEPEFLNALVKKFSNPDTELAYCQSHDIDAVCKIVGDRLSWTTDFTPNIWADDFEMPGEEFAQYLKVKNVIPNASACLIRKNAFEPLLKKYGEDLAKFKFGGDWYLWLKLCRLPDSNIFFTSRHLNYFRVSESSTRHFSTIQKKEKRILEEQFIVNDNQVLFGESELKERLKKLRHKWFGLHNKFSLFTKSFYHIAREPNYPSIALLYHFILYKWKKN